MARGRQPTGNPPGRPKKPPTEKRLPLSLLVSPALRRRLVTLAKENRRSVTQQTEMLLERALDSTKGDALRLDRIEQ